MAPSSSWRANVVGLVVLTWLMVVHAQPTITVVTLHDGNMACLNSPISGVLTEMTSDVELKKLLTQSFVSSTATDAAACDSWQHNASDSHTSIVSGVIPDSFAISNNLIVMDPINLTSGLHQSNNNFIYLFAVLEQQLHMAAYYCKNEHINAADIRVLIRSSSNSGAISAAAKTAFAYYGIALPSSSLVASSATITDELLTTGFTFVVGLATSDVAPLVSFLDTQIAATVMVDFDDLTLLYDTFVTSFGTVVKPSMSRLLYATNLPRWTNASIPNTMVAVPSSTTGAGDDVMEMFFAHMPHVYHSPAGLRAFTMMLFADAVVEAAGAHNTSDVINFIYKSGGFDVAGQHYGTFSTACAAPVAQGATCAKNVGAMQLRMFSYAGAVVGGVFHANTPVGVPSADAPDEVNSDKNIFLWAILGVIGLMLVLLVILLFMCCCYGQEDDKDEVTVVVVQKPNGDDEGVLQGLMRGLIAQDGCKTDESGALWVLLAASPLAAIKFAEKLRTSVAEVVSESIHPVMVGIHTGPVSGDAAPPAGMSKDFAGCAEVVAVAQSTASMCDGTQFLVTSETHGLLTPGECKMYGIVHHRSCRISGTTMEIYQLCGTDEPAKDNEDPLTRHTDVVDADGNTESMDVDRHLPPPLSSEEVRVRGEAQSTMVMVPEPLTTVEVMPRRGEDGAVVEEVVPLQSWESVAAAAPPPVKIVEPLQSFEEIKPGGERRVMAAPIDDGRPPTPLCSFEVVKPDGRRTLVSEKVEEGPMAALHSYEEVKPTGERYAHAPAVKANEDATVVPALHSYEEVKPRTSEGALVKKVEEALPVPSADPEEIVPLESFEEVLPRSVVREDASARAPSRTDEAARRASSISRTVAVDEPSTPLESWECVPSSHVSRRRVTYVSAGAQTEEGMYVPPASTRELQSGVMAERRDAREEAATVGAAHNEHTSGVSGQDEVANTASPEKVQTRVVPDVASNVMEEETEAKHIPEEPVEQLHDKESQRASVHSERDPTEPEGMPTEDAAAQSVTHPPAEDAAPELDVVEAPLNQGAHTSPERYATSQDSAPFRDPSSADEAPEEESGTHEEAAAHVPEPVEAQVEECIGEDVHEQPFEASHEASMDQLPEEHSPARTGRSHEDEPADEYVEIHAAPVKAAEENLLKEVVQDHDDTEEVHHSAVEEPPAEQEKCATPFADDNDAHMAPSRRTPEVAEEDVAAAQEEELRRISGGEVAPSVPASHMPPRRIAENAALEEPAAGPAASPFVRGRPTAVGDKMVPCFEVENGLLFRITDSESGKWGFYNDTDEYIMHVRFSLGRKSRVVPLGSMVIQEDPETGRFEGEVMLHPGCTEMVFMGHVNGHRMRYYAIPTSRECHA